MGWSSGPKPPTPGHRAGGEVGLGGQLHLFLFAHITTQVLPPLKSAAAFDSHRSVNPNPEVRAAHPEIATKEKYSAQ